jgi:O-antigen polymerase
MMYDHPHNELLYWLIEAGVVSIVGMLLFAIATLRQLFGLGWQRGLAYVALMTPITLHMLVELPFYLSSFHWFVWLLLLYLIHSHFSVVYSVKLSLLARRLVPAAGLGAVLLVAIFLFSTLQSLRGMTNFAMRGDGNMAMIQSATSNPVLSELAMLYTFRYLLYADIHSGQSRYVDQYIDLAERYMQYMPVPDVMSDLVLAYTYRQDPQNAQRVMDEAVSIYPRNEYLVEQQAKVREGKAMDYFRETKITGK